MRKRNVGLLVLAGLIVLTWFFVPHLSFAGSSSKGSVMAIDGVNWSSDYSVCTLSPTSTGTPIDGATLEQDINQHTTKLKRFETEDGACLQGSYAYLFDMCAWLESVDLSHLVHSSATDMTGMFQNCSSLISVVFPKNLDTTAVKSMGSMFHGCYELSSLILPENFYTANVLTMEGMFHGCMGFSSLDLSSFNTSSVVYMNGMFADCYNISSLVFPATFTTLNTTNTSCMFEDCHALTSLNLSTFNTQKVNNMSCMFYQCTSLSTLTLPGTFTTASVTDMSEMFEGCSVLNAPNFSSFETQNVTKMAEMFKDCSSFVSLDISSFKANDNVNCLGMFANCNNLKELNLGDFVIPQGRKGIAVFADYNDITRAIRGRIPNIQKITLSSECTLSPGTGYTLDSASGNFFDYKTPLPWRAFQDGVFQEDVVGYDEFQAYQASHPGLTTYLLGISFSVSFDSNGGSDVLSQEVMNYSNATQPQDPTRQGYAFQYWSSDSELSTPFDFSTPITEDTVLYAKWEALPEPVPTDGWSHSDAGWRYAVNGSYVNDGWHYIIDEFGEHWYYFDTDTYMATSHWIWDEATHGWYWVCSTGPMIENLWQWIDNAWYGFWWGGKMCQGWIWDNAQQAWYLCNEYTGRVACNEWAWAGGWYYFGQDCKMFSNCWVGDYWLNYQGMWV